MPTPTATSPSSTLVRLQRLQGSGVSRYWDVQTLILFNLLAWHHSFHSYKSSWLILYPNLSKLNDQSSIVLQNNKCCSRFNNFIRQVTQYACGTEFLGGPPNCQQYFTGTSGILARWVFHYVPISVKSNSFDNSTITLLLKIEVSLWKVLKVSVHTS